MSEKSPGEQPESIKQDIVEGFELEESSKSIKNPSEIQKKFTEAMKIERIKDTELKRAKIEAMKRFRMPEDEADQFIANVYADPHRKEHLEAHAEADLYIENKREERKRYDEKIKHLRESGKPVSEFIQRFKDLFKSK
ncbi:MAG: hypothetical protein US35_C0015G0005 [Parcubacteria group bacterium GW2011_GWA2_37_10]|nr:MAG: hypothetical protein US35_C0015G0005 [Parcubacteria group bacterium GW2011_GWA2_37_10]HLD38121.1 hypothetical protein [Candidatus Nanoarchaeia archaeon]